MVEEAKHIADLRVCKAAVKLVRREKGTEKQHRFSCTQVPTQFARSRFFLTMRVCCRLQCGVLLFYRPQPLEMPTKYLYVLPGALSATKKTFDETDGKASEVSEAQIDGQSGAAKMGGGDAPVTTASPPPAVVPALPS